eukprot:GHVR01134660.1.p1 GENE.GHVR01134660.1~~GHVR01134660.1.p1  ORF type:complete len:139 (+),score=31.28 GHVR01134660.1:265-681(+)
MNSPTESAICLYCGAVVCMGVNSACGCGKTAAGIAGVINAKGECTRHAETCGGGNGLFIVPSWGAALSVSSGKCGFTSEPYADKFGEGDLKLRRGRPLSLVPHRLKRLQTLLTTGELHADLLQNSTNLVIQHTNINIV